MEFYGAFFNFVTKRVPYSPPSPFLRTSPMSPYGCIISTHCLSEDDVHLFNVTFGLDHSSGLL